MRDGYRLVDADRHVMEPVDLWQRYLPADLRHRAPALAAAAPAADPSFALEDRVRRYGPKALLPLPPALMLEGRTVWSDMPLRTQIELSWESHARRHETAAVARPEGHLEEMDRSGVDVAFLYPTLALYVAGFDPMEPRLGSALAAAYNDWLRDYCQTDPVRLRGVGLVSTHDPAAMADEVARVSGFGWTAVMILPNVVEGRTLAHPAYEPFWSACERLSVGVAVHAASHTRLPVVGAGRFTSHFALHACAHPMEQMMALLSLIEGGVLERHPALRVAFVESGCGWVPYWIHRLDAIEYAHYAGEVEETVKRKPSEYFARQCFVVMEPDEPCLPAFVEQLGADSLLLGTDFPHGDHGDDIVDQTLGLAGKLGPDVLHRILWDNPARFYRLDGGSLGRVASPSREP